MSMKAPPVASPVDVGLLGLFQPEEVLYEAEQPIVFTTRTPAGQALLAYLADEGVQDQWFLLSPCTDDLVDDLRQGRVFLRETLTRSWMWLAHVTGQSVQEVWAVTPEMIPAQHLPRPGTPLLAAKPPT